MPNDRFYTSTAWLAMRARIRKRDRYQCQRCGAACRAKGSSVVDHRIPRAERPDLELDPGNLWLICRACHDGWKKTVERNSHKPTIGSDGYPPSWGEG